MDEVKKQVPFKWELGEETVSLEIGQYAYGERLYIGITSHTEDGPEPFADITNDLLRFIRENKLGKVLPYRVRSGYGQYSVVAFDLEKLKEFDPKGVSEFKKTWNIPEKKPAKKKNRGMER